MPSKRVELPSNMLRMIASKLTNQNAKTLARFALTHKQMAADLKKRLTSIRQRARKQGRSPTTRQAPVGAPAAKRRRM
jgi:hypothetical protein